MTREDRPSSAAELSGELTRAAGVAPASELEVGAWVVGLMEEVGELKPRGEEATRSLSVTRRSGSS